jgi:hypothetical protein
MILLAYGKQAPSLTHLVKLGVKEGAMTDRGWLHAAIAGLATRSGIPARAEPVEPADLVSRLAGAPLIVSVTGQFPDDGRKGGHLVVARGFLDGPDPGILICDPSSWGQAHCQVPLSRLAASYSGRAITFAPLTTRRERFDPRPRPPAGPAPRALPPRRPPQRSCPATA